jgi:tight adherence protein C
MILAICAAVFVVLVGLISFAGYRYYVKPSKFQTQLGTLDDTDKTTAVAIDASGGAQERKWFVRIVQTIGEKVPISPQEAGMARRTLIAAGFRSERAVRVLYGCKLILAILLFIGAVFAFPHIGNPVLRYAALFAGPFAGFFLPTLIVDKMVVRRHEKIKFALPDALDLMVVCMEAGLGLDQAIDNVARELKLTHPALSEELALVTLEMRAGKRRIEALKNLAERAGESELKKLVATMVQADRFGTGVADSLRTHSDFMRVRRRQDAEERAAKVGVKLVFPIFFLILPAMLVVTAGPGLISLFKGLLPLMRGEAPGG